MELALKAALQTWPEGRAIPDPSSDNCGAFEETHMQRTGTAEKDTFTAFSELRRFLKTTSFASMDMT